MAEKKKAYTFRKGRMVPYESGSLMHRIGKKMKKRKIKKKA